MQVGCQYLGIATIASLNWKDAWLSHLFLKKQQQQTQLLTNKAIYISHYILILWHCEKLQWCPPTLTLGVSFVSIFSAYKCAIAQEEEKEQVLQWVFCPWSLQT